MPFRDLEEFFDGACRLPIGGKTYVIKPLNAKDGLWAQAVMDATVRASLAARASQTGAQLPADLPDVQLKRLDDAEERDFYQVVLGDTLDEMVEDGVHWPGIQRAAQTAYLFFTVGEEAAQRRWEDVEGKAMAPRAERRKARKATAKSTR